MSNAKQIFEDYSKQHIRFIRPSSELKLLSQVLDYTQRSGRSTIVDIGCGEGSLIHSIKLEGLIKDVKIIGIDISGSMVRSFRINTQCDAIIAAGENLPLRNNSIDLVLCLDVIEHVRNETHFLRDIFKVVNINGLLYLLTPLKSKYSFSYYIVNGKMRCDPTHIREYQTPEEVLDALQEVGFSVLQNHIRLELYPLVEIIIRLFVKVGILSQEFARTIFLRSKLLFRLRALKIYLKVGYRSVEFIAIKKRN